MPAHDNVPDDHEIARYFDERADEGFMAGFSAAEREKLEQALRRWNIRPGCRILEPGCGTGRLTGYLAQTVGPDGEVFACDISKAMIDRARGRGLPVQAVFHHGTAADIPRGEGWFDMIVCFAAFPHFTGRERTLAEFRRVLCSGGGLQIEHFKSRAEINSIHRRAGDIIVSHSIPDEKEMRTILVNAGFTVQEIAEENDSYSLHAVKS